MNADQSNPRMEYHRDNQYPKMNFTTSISTQHTIPPHMHSKQAPQMDNRSLLQSNASPVCKYSNLAKSKGPTANEPLYAMENATAHTADPLNRMPCGAAVSASASTATKAAAAMKRELDGGRAMQSTAMVNGPYSKECKFAGFSSYL